MSTLEAYLRTVYHELMPKDEERHHFLNVKELKEVFSKALLKKDIFEGRRLLEFRINEIFVKRHVIVHRAGEIDQKACSDAGWNRDLAGKQLSLTSAVVMQDIKKMDEFADIIHEAIRRRI